MTKDGETQYTESGRRKAKKELSDRQKKALKIGAVTAGALLASYGAYKLGYLDDVQAKGKQALDSLLGKVGDHKLTVGSAQGFSRLPKRESIETAISKVNPTRARNNCYNCVVATAARLCGYDVTAKGDTRNGKGMPFDMLCRPFGLDPDNSRDVAHVTSPTVNRIANAIARRYSEGDVGAVGLEWSEAYRKTFDRPAEESLGHVLNWMVRNGRVEFMDGQSNRGNHLMQATMHQWMSSEKEASIAKFGNIFTGLDKSAEELSRFVDSR